MARFSSESACFRCSRRFKRVDDSWLTDGCWWIRLELIDVARLITETLNCLPAMFVYLSEREKKKKWNVHIRKKKEEKKGRERERNVDVLRLNWEQHLIVEFEIHWLANFVSSLWKQKKKGICFFKNERKFASVKNTLPTFGLNEDRRVMSSNLSEKSSSVNIELFAEKRFEKQPIDALTVRFSTFLPRQRCEQSLDK